MTEKIFGVGLSRTGTTTLTSMLQTLGYRSVHWPCSESVSQDILSGNLKLKIFDEFDAIIDCSVIIVAYRRLASLYPNAKFILTVRKNREDWLRSVKHHWEQANERWNHWAQPLSEEAKLAYMYRWIVFGTSLFDREHYSHVYETHWRNVLLCFRQQAERLLVYDVHDSWKTLCAFLNKPIPNVEQPWLNRVSY